MTQNVQLTKLTQTLGYAFKNETLLKEALTHRSAGTPHNERLEFLGDAVLDLVIANTLLKRYPNHKEGALSPLRAMLVKGETLASLAQNLGLGEAIFLGPGEIKTGGATRQSVLANALEALFGAVFLDGGFQPAEKLILTIYQTPLQQLDTEALFEKDSKTALQEYLHAKKVPLARYSLIDAKGAAHEKLFSVMCEVSTLNRTTKAAATTRKKAEQLAAKAMLDALKQNQI